MTKNTRNDTPLKETHPFEIVYLCKSLGKTYCEDVRQQVLSQS